MQVHDKTDSEGLIFAFEIKTIGREEVCKILEKIPGIVFIKKPKRLSFLTEEMFCEVQIANCRIRVKEPLGLRSRYWIGTQDAPAWHPEIEVARQAFLSV